MKKFCFSINNRKYMPKTDFSDEASCYKEQQVSKPTEAAEIERNKT